MSRQKITIVGAGNVGGSVAQRLAEKSGYDIVLVDIVEGLPEGKALDLAQAGAVCGYDSPIRGSNRYEDTTDSDVVVVTSGIARKPGMSRSELLETNINIVRSVVQEVAIRSPAAVLVIVANPLDAMTYVAYRVSGFPKQRVVGMAGILDSARFCTFIARELNVSVHNVQAMVLGGHGDAMVPLIRYTTVAGRPVDQWMSRGEARRPGEANTRRVVAEKSSVSSRPGVPTTHRRRPWSKWSRLSSGMTTRYFPARRCVKASTA